jgi:basic membrane protein A and related proteins
MKKKLYLVLGIVLITVFLLTACKPAAAVATEAPAADKLVVINLINGVLGDKSFFDSSNEGMQRAVTDFGIELKTIEAGIDPAQWQPALEDAAANEEYDVLIVGTYQMGEFLQIVAAKYPDKKFIMYDQSVDYTACDCGNVYSITYKQNEGSYLAGYYAGLMSQTGMIGAVGGQDIPVINDFIVGYTQGAVDAGLDANNVVVQYAGGWNDPAKGKELALAMYQQGADIVFNVAGGTGVGIFQAAQEMGKYAIGVDSDQATIIADTNPDQAAFIITSMQKLVGNSLYRAIKMHIDGTLPYGTAESLGIKEGGVGLAFNKYYDAVTSQEIKDKVNQAMQDVIDGKITVDTVFK